MPGCLLYVLLVKFTESTAFHILQAKSEFLMCEEYYTTFRKRYEIGLVEMLIGNHEMCVRRSWSIELSDAGHISLEGVSMCIETKESINGKIGFHQDDISVRSKMLAQAIT